MTHNLIIRGFDDEVHSRLGELANQKGVSINSMVKDAVDKWLKRQSEILRKHYLVIYSDDDSIIGLIKSMDTLAKEADLVRCFCGPPNSLTTKHLTKLNWRNETVEPYIYQTSSSILPHYRERQQKQQQQQQSPTQVKGQKNVMKYIGKVMENIVENARGKQVCCLDFLINDVAKASLKEALAIEHAYDNDRISGLMHCTYKTDTLLSSELDDMIELFEMHDQIFIIKDHDVYKLQITKENVHKLFLN